MLRNLLKYEFPKFQFFTSCSRELLLKKELCNSGKFQRKIFLGKEKVLYFISQTTLVQLCIKNLAKAKSKMLIECCYFLSSSSLNQLYPLFKAYIYLNHRFEGIHCYIPGGQQ